MVTAVHFIDEFDKLRGIVGIGFARNDRKRYKTHYDDEIKRYLLNNYKRYNDKIKRVNLWLLFFGLIACICVLFVHYGIKYNLISLCRRIFSIRSFAVSIEVSLTTGSNTSRTTKGLDWILSSKFIIPKAINM